MIQSNATTVAELLQETRRVAGFSTRSIAPLVGVSFSTIAKWERGESEPSVSQFVLWCRATKQPADRMIDGLSAMVNSHPEGWGFESLRAHRNFDADFWAIVRHASCQDSPDAEISLLGAVL